MAGTPSLYIFPGTPRAEHGGTECGGTGGGDQEPRGRKLERVFPGFRRMGLVSWKYSVPNIEEGQVEAIASTGALECLAS